MNDIDMGFSWLEYANLFWQCGGPVILLAVGWLVGSTVERSHFQSLRRRERELMTIPVTDLKTVPPGVIGARGGVLVMGSVVVASDYFKTFVASLRKLIGGEINSYERLMVRARGEALLRLMQQAHEHHALAVINIRFETSSIARMSRNPSPMVEVVAYATAVLPAAMGS